MFIDSHAHISSDAFSMDEWDSYLQRAKEQGVTKVINICSDLTALKNGILLAEQHSNVFLAAACPPHDVEEHGKEFFAEFKKLIDHSSVVAVGETGLDYYYENLDKETQRYHLKKYLVESIQRDLPCVIHCREAFQDFFSILDEIEAEHGAKVRGVLHCFTGTNEEALELVKRHWYVSYSGIVTFKKSIELRKTLKVVPLNHILIETDSPYLAPPPFRGKRNESSYLPEIAKVVAEQKGVPLDVIANQTTENANELFGLL
jgi:TatD DNase family protein